MSGVLLDRRKHPAKTKLSDALRDDTPVLKARKGLIDKKFTMIKAPGTDTAAGLEAPMRPTDEQVARINQFTRSPKTADELVCFTTLSCNDIPDRDDDQFTKQCVQDFAALEQPFSPVGKSFMLDHEYSVENAVGRIFGVDTKKVKGSNFLTNEVYMPNTEQFQPLIEKIDFGINWAVSVGVMLGKDQCSLPWCKAPFSSWGYWCQNGHDKGAWYVKDAEEDGWGFPLPSNPETAGAEKCLRLFMEPRDMYELSMVFLGAQYFAALEKDPDFASVLKAATTKGLPVLSLGNGDIARKLPLRHVPDKVSEALQKYKVEEIEDGTLTWVDDQKLVWVFDPQDPDSGAQSLGKASNDDDDEGEEDNDGTEDEGSESDEGDNPEGEDDERSATGSDDPAGEGSGSDNPGAASEQHASSDASGDQEVTDEDDSDDAEEDDDADEEDEEEKGVSKENVLASARRAKLPAEVISTVEKAKGNGLDALLLHVSEENETLRQKVGDLTEKASLGDEYLKGLRADAIDWYVKAHTDANGPVSVEKFERMLERIGNDPELVKDQIEEQKRIAQERFPGSHSKAPRRSSDPSDPNERKEPEAEPFGPGNSTAEKVRRIHG